MVKGAIANLIAENVLLVCLKPVHLLEEAVAFAVCYVVKEAIANLIAENVLLVCWKHVHLLEEAVAFAV